MTPSANSGYAPLEQMRANNVERSQYSPLWPMSDGMLGANVMEEQDAAKKRLVIAKGDNLLVMVNGSTQKKKLSSPGCSGSGMKEDFLINQRKSADILTPEASNPILASFQYSHSENLKSSPTHDQNAPIRSNSPSLKFLNPNVSSSLMPKESPKHLSFTRNSFKESSGTVHDNSSSHKERLYSFDDRLLLSPKHGPLQLSTSGCSSIMPVNSTTKNAVNFCSANEISFSTAGLDANLALTKEQVYSGTNYLGDCENNNPQQIPQLMPLKSLSLIGSNLPSRNEFQSKNFNFRNPGFHTLGSKEHFPIKTQATSTNVYPSMRAPIWTQYNPYFLMHSPLENTSNNLVTSLLVDPSLKLESKYSSLFNNEILRFIENVFKEVKFLLLSNIIASNN